MKLVSQRERSRNGSDSREELIGYLKIWEMKSAPNSRSVCWVFQQTMTQPVDGAVELATL